MLTNYFWNIALSESLYPSLHAVELALRNTINQTLIERAKSRPGDLLTWWDNRYTITTSSLQKLNNVRAEYYSKFKQAISPDLLVANLSFGFWIFMLSGSQQKWIWLDKQHGWIDRAFPHRSRASINRIYRQFDEIKNLRNRVMHYECIFDLPNLLQLHGKMHQAIQWINPGLHIGIHTVDSFPEIYQNGWERAYVKLHNRLGGP